MSLLKLEHINTGYGKKKVLFDINLEIKEGESVLLIGSNGSGKSTLLKVIYGLLPLWRTEGITGEIKYRGQDIRLWKPNDLIGNGIVYIPQQNELFEGMTVKENLETSVLHLNDKRTTKDRLEEVFEEAPLLQQKESQLTSQLSGGERKQLSLGMAMMNRPKLLMLDEPLAGVSADRIASVKNTISRFKRRGTSLFIVEHRVKEFFDFVNTVMGIRQGQMLVNPIQSIDNTKKFLV